MSRERPPVSLLIRWAKLLCGLLLIWIFVFLAAPALQQLAPVRRLHEHTRRNDIDATALFYTDADEFADAETYVVDSLSR